MDARLYSLRMRASRKGKHCSGGERIVSRNEVDAATAELVARALGGGGGAADEVHCIAERIDPATVHYGVLPALTTHAVADWREGRCTAGRLLEQAGVAPAVAASALRLLAAGPAPGGAVMRGAVLMDAHSGKRLEADPERGVRVSRMDLVPRCRRELLASLKEQGLGHHRVAEALVLAGKVLSAPGLLAELCWSDDPGYLAGYVADPVRGYQRITPLKAAGDPRGGRIFFLAAGTSVDELSDYLERQPVLFTGFAGDERS